VSYEMTQAVENGLLPANTIKGKPLPILNLADRMKRYNVPGVSIAVIDQTAIAWAQGYGVQQAGTSDPVTTQTRFQAASISKPVSAMAALWLVQSGKLDLDADVNHILRSWQVPENEHTRDRKATLRGVLSHTAGLTVHGFPGYAAGEEVPSVRQILDGEPPANTEPVRVEHVPGSQFQYSGGGYTVMQQLLEDITGQPFSEFMQSTVLDRLQMDHSTFEQPLPQEYAGDAATAHTGNGQPVDGKWHTYPERAAAGLWTTPSDLARYAIEILKSSTGGSNRILSVEMTREMLTPIMNNHGLGPRIQKFDDSIEFSHAGGNEGFRCFLVGYTGAQQGAVVMTNSDNGNVLMMEIIRSIAHAYGWPDFRPTEKSVVPVDPKLYNQYEGEYRLGDFLDYGAVIKKENERLIMESLPDGICYELHAESETQYFSEEQEGTIAFVKDADEKVNTLMINSQWKMERVK
jgi:CubicO group peptidase (beta-lactamase class C family)